MNLCKSIIFNKENTLDINNINFKIEISEKFPKSLINKKYKNLLNNIKNIACNIDNWTVYRRLFTTLNFLNFHINKKNIGIYKKNILSRSFFKMIEIHNTYNIFKDYKNSNIKVALIAEAPGGFVEALYKLRKYNVDDKYYGISLINKHQYIPSWSYYKKKYSNNKKLSILEGFDKTGNIYKLSNMLNFIKTIGKHSCEIVTADGGFDFTDDYINQEYSFSRLFLCEIILALNLQKKGGNFIIKCFDLTHTFTIKLFYLLCNLYDKVIITKLTTSRQTNSERFIICKNLLHHLDDNTMWNFFNIIVRWDMLVINNKIHDIFNFNIPYSFLNKMDTYNGWFFQKQLDIFTYILDIEFNINNTITDNIVKDTVKNNIETCIMFCKVNNLFIDYSSPVLKTSIEDIVNYYFVLKK
tara:strand:+ start:8122 stop:9357 length:1236 start_codon:yes stop_codon:yes gene_type:complete